MNNWNDTEDKINKIIDFTKSHILLSPYHNNDPIKCNECLFREISILVVSNKIFLNKLNHNGLIWVSGKMTDDKTSGKVHGADWHNNQINLIRDYFKFNNYAIEDEPLLFYGRADLGISKLGIYIEVGTMNLYKLYYNLINMKNCKFLLVPSTDYVLEFIL